MTIEIKVVDGNSLLKQYIFLPEKIYKGDARWVPPLYADEWAFHNPNENKALTYCDTIRVLAFADNKPVGRIMGIIHHPYNQQHNEKTVRFFNLDCINNQSVAEALIRYIETWGKNKGMNNIIGPFGFSDKDPQGLQVDGLEHLPVLATPTNPAYLQELVERVGFTKKVDCVSYCMPIEQAIPPVYEKIFDRIQRNKTLKLIEFTSKKKLKPYIIPVFRLVNEAYAHIFGFVPMTEEEMKKFAAQYLPVLDPSFVKVVVDQHDTLIAFVVAMPDMSVGMQRSKGKLFPFGFIHILLSMQKATQLNLLLGAVKPGHQGKGITVLLGKSILESARKRNMKLMDSHLILENNQLMRSECERVGGTVYKRFRVYHKMIS
jgi:GNAT superfamily N-acetyltransferase